MYYIIITNRYLWCLFLLQVAWRTPDAPQYQKAVVKRKKYRFNTYRPWTQQFKLANAPGKHYKKVFLEPVLEWSFFK